MGDVSKGPTAWFQIVSRFLRSFSFVHFLSSFSFSLVDFRSIALFINEMLRFPVMIVLCSLADIRHADDV